MADASRLTVKNLVLHHAVTHLWDEKSKAQLAQWFSDNGFARAYGSNPANWSGLINPYTGARSYSQAHLAGQRVTDRTPDATAAEKKAGYRLVPLVQDIWGQITWHAGNWPINQSSIGIENLGDYRNYTLRDGDVKVIADFWRPQDQKLGGRTAVYGHKEVSSLGTECPARIMEKRDAIVNAINTAPAPTPTPTPSGNVKKYEKIAAKQYELIRDANLWDFNAASYDKMKAVKSFKKGDKLDIVGQAVHKTGSVYYMTAYSFGKADTTGKPTATTGINKADLKEVVVPPKPVITTKEETKTEVIAFTKKLENDPTMLVGQKVVKTVGVNGERTIVYTVTLTDGKETGRVVKSSTVTKQPVDEVTLVGTLTKDDQQDQRLGVIERFIEALKKALEKIGIKL